MTVSNIKTDPHEIWGEYQDGVEYNQNLDLYETVKDNENFYNDKQWEDLNAPDLDKPTLNFIKPVVNYYVALMISDDIALNVELGAGATEEQQELIPKVLQSAVDDVMEYTNLRYHNRRVIRNAAVDADACMHVYYDPTLDSGEAVKGDIAVEVLDNTNVFFGDTSSPDVQTQPYIILSYRTLISTAQRKAELNNEDPDLVTADSEDSLYLNTDKNIDGRYATILRKYWRDDKTGHIWGCETCQNGYIKKPVDLELKRYPVAWMSWEEVKNSYHGISPVTGKIANQTFVNKMYAMAMQYSKLYSFPKVVYDKTKLKEGWNNRIGQAVGVNGNPRDTVLIDSIGAGGFNAQSLDLANQTISQTKDLMGASDAALGNVRPDNTSAIIAVQKAANAPLDIQRLVFYNFVEDVIRNMIDIMRVNYGERSYIITADDGTDVTGTFDYNELNDVAMKLKIDIGQGTYWSELMQMQTLDAMKMQNIVPDAVTYLECLPDGVIKGKQKIIDRWKQIEEQQHGMLPEGAEAPEIPENVTPMEAPEEQAEPESYAADISDEDLASLCAELEQVPEEKRMQVLEKLQLSDDTKQKIAMMLEQRGGGSENAVS